MFEYFGVERRVYCVRVIRNRIRAASAWPLFFFVMSDDVRRVASSNAVMCCLMLSSRVNMLSRASKPVVVRLMSTIAWPGEGK